MLPKLVEIVLEAEYSYRNGEITRADRNLAVMFHLSLDNEKAERELIKQRAAELATA